MDATLRLAGSTLVNIPPWLGSSKCPWCLKFFPTVGTTTGQLGTLQEGLTAGFIAKSGNVRPGAARCVTCANVMTSSNSRSSTPLHSSQRCSHLAAFGTVRNADMPLLRQTTGMCAIAVRQSGCWWAPIAAACRSSFCSPAQLVTKAGRLEVLQAKKMKSCLWNLLRPQQAPRMMASPSQAQTRDGPLGT